MLGQICSNSPSAVGLKVIVGRSGIQRSLGSTLELWELARQGCLSSLFEKPSAPGAACPAMCAIACMRTNPLRVSVNMDVWPLHPRTLERARLCKMFCSCVLLEVSATQSQVVLVFMCGLTG